MSAMGQLGPGAMFAQCPDYPRKRPCSGHYWTPQKCQKQTHAPQRNTLFDHVVGAREHRPGNGQACLASGLDHKLELSGLLDPAWPDLK